MAEKGNEGYYFNNKPEGNKMAEVYVISLSKFNLYLKCIGDNLSLSFIDNPYDTLFFTKEIADEVVRLINVNTPYFLTVEPINEEEDAHEES